MEKQGNLENERKMRIVVKDRRFKTGKHYSFDKEVDYSNIPVISLTDKVQKHYQTTKSGLNYSTFRGLTLKDILSILSATKRGEALVNVDRWGNVYAYKLQNNLDLNRYRENEDEEEEL